ncbi:juvenile hormone acid O-methyltransferase-like [Tachypleus tridentatus]|uniref:juvenile hormone acid O-methyltransferase-like n=1 Tax=Tachypleus tridentatus TaxID=6853 RepID=UPI003FD441C9
MSQLEIWTRRSKSRSRSNVSDLSLSGTAEYDGYLISLHDKLLSECFNLTTIAEWAKARVLEVGCGCGDTTRQLVDRLPIVRDILGVDIDVEAIDYAFSIHADEKLDFANVNIQDINTFDLKWGGKFDWMFSSHALLWAREQSTVLKNLLWCLKPGGRCFIAVPAGKPPDIHAAVTKVLKSSSWSKYFVSSSDLVTDLTDANYNRLWFHHPNADRVYSALLEQAGYHVLKTKLVDFRYTFTSNDEYKECVRSLLRQLIEIIPDGKKQLFTKDMLKAAVKKANKAKDGNVMWNINYAVVVAKRPELQ